VELRAGVLEDEGEEDADDDDGTDDGTDDGADGMADAGDDDDDLPIIVKEGEGGYILIEGGENGIVAVGNSEAKVEGTSCDIIPEPTSKGNAEIEIDCGASSENSE